MTHTSLARSLAVSLFPARKAAVRGWGAVALLLILASHGPARLGEAVTRTPSKTPKAGGTPPRKESEQAHTYGTVRTVLDAVNLVVVRPEGAPVTAVSGLMLNDWTIVSRSDLTDVRQLAGKQVAVHSESSMAYSVTKYVIKKENIPDVRVLFIAGSNNKYILPT